MPFTPVVDMRHGVVPDARLHDHSMLRSHPTRWMPVCKGFRQSISIHFFMFVLLLYGIARTPQQRF